MKHKKFLLIFLLFYTTILLQAQPLQRISPQKAELDPQKLAYADEVIQKSIMDQEIPGAVLAVVRNGKMVYIKAFGNKQIYPNAVAMTENTVFDMASVSKSMSTAICTMILVEQGKISLRDKVNLFIPNFNGWKGDKNKITDIRIIDLLTHTSGLPPYAPVDSLKKKYGSPNPNGLIEYISTCKRDFVPGTDFQYSCLNFISLQRIIEKVSGQNLRDFAKQNVFDILGMKHTDYNPTGEILSLCAPTEKQKNGVVLKGVVHDPLARIMNGGISGNAGVFSTAEDLAILAAVLLNEGECNGKRILSSLAVKKMTSIPKGLEEFGRMPGWDNSSSYASFTGDLFSSKVYGHTGYTGTSLIIDPENNIAVILLTNRVHPEDEGSVTRLRTLVANIVAGAILE